MTRKRHDWERLKAEYVAGDWKTVTDFFNDKKILLTNRYRAVGWVGAKKSYRKKVLETSEKRMIREDAQDITKIRDRHARLARFMILKGAETLKTEKVETVDEARKLMVSGMHEERKATGIDSSSGITSVTQININPKTNLDKLIAKLNYEGILGLIAELKQDRERSSLQEASSGGTRQIEEGEVI